MPFVRATVIVCAYTQRRWQQLQAAVGRAREQLTRDDELVVVIDHNPRLHSRAVDRWGTDPRVRVLKNHSAKGLSGARNSGLASARGRYLVFLDDDAEPCAGWLEALLASYDRPGVIGVGGAAHPVWPAEAPRWLPAEFLWVVGCSYRGLPESTSPVRNPIGANMSFRADAFARVGGFQECLGRVGGVPLGCEETEFAIRATAGGAGTVLYEPRAAVRHHVSADRVKFRYFVSRCWSEGLSKAAVSRLAGARDGLASERRYVVQVLPRAVARSVGRGLHGDPWAVAQAASVVIGAAVTLAGWSSGSARRSAAAALDRPGTASSAASDG